MYSKDLIDKVKQLYDQDKSIAKVASKLSLPYTTVQYMVKNDYDRVKGKRGRPKLLKEREKTKIKRSVRQLNQRGEKVSALKVINETNSVVSKSTMRRQLNELGFKYKKVKQSIVLTQKHKAERLEHCQKWINENQDWSSTVFSDEKRFSFDGPDNFLTYSDGSIPMTRKKRQQGGGSIMVWGCVLSDGFILLQRMIGRQRSSDYCQLLETKVQPFLQTKLNGKLYTFQQDNCSIHVSKESLAKLKQLFPNVMKWPSRSPDLNIMENVWKMLSDIVYADKQYSDSDSLWKSVLEAAEVIMTSQKDKISNLFNSMPRRCLKVVMNKGNIINY